MNPADVCLRPRWELCEEQSWFEYMHRLQGTQRLKDDRRPTMNWGKIDGLSASKEGFIGRVCDKKK